LIRNNKKIKLLKCGPTFEELVAKNKHAHVICNGVVEPEHYHILVGVPERGQGDELATP